MIIKKNVKSLKSDSSKTVKMPKSNVIKKEDFKPAQKDIQTEDKDLKNIQDTSPTSKKNTKEVPLKDDDVEKIDISSIEFKERIERRRGDRRRGYRRIDERSLVSRAQQEAHTIKELAAREGYQNGLLKAQKELEDVKKSLVEILNMKDDVEEEFYPHIAEVALAAAQKIIKKEVEMSPDILKSVIYDALDELNSDAQKVDVKVNSADIEFAKLSLPEIIEAKNLDVKVTVTPDDTVEAGSCVIVANNGVIDANFKTQLAVLQNAFGIYKGGM